MSSADNLCKQFGPRSGPTKCRAWSGSKLFDTLNMIIPEIIFWKSWFWKSADNLCKQFGPSSGLTKCWARSGSKLFDTQNIFLKEFFEKVDFEKNQQTAKKHTKLPSRQRVSFIFDQYQNLMNVEFTITYGMWEFQGCSVFYLNLCIWDIFMCFCCRLVTLTKFTFSKYSFMNTIRVSYSLVPDQNSCSVRLDLGPNCLQRLSSDDKNRR